MDIIKIKKCIETIDNWGNVEVYKDDNLFKLLITPEDWTDDQVFIGEGYDEGSYYIDDLIGKQVQVGPFIFKVQEYNL